MFFVQVGSNDGVAGDPIRELILGNLHWRGVFIEPVGYAFQNLVRNYGRQERFKFEQVAIAESAGERPFFYVSPAASSDPLTIASSDKLGSFDKNHILRHSPHLAKYIICETLKCEPLEAVLARNGVDDLDLVHIDVEGYDYQVLRQIDFYRYEPRLILFEHSHLSQNDLSDATSLLRRRNYKLVNCGLDTLAIRQQGARAS